MKRTYFTKNHKYFTVWWVLSVVYFVGLKLFRIFFDRGYDFDGLLTTLIFVFSLPIFSAVSGFLAYKATARVIIPNIANVVIMFVVNAPSCLIAAGEWYDKYHTPSTSYAAVVFEYIGSLLLLALPIYIISVISSAITKLVIRKRNQWLEKDEIE